MTDEHRHDLGRSAIRGAQAIGLARVVSETALLFASIALARLLSPAEFGHAAVPLAVVGLAVLLGPAGMTALIVQRRDLREEHVQAATFLTLVGGAVASGLTLIVAGTFGSTVFGAETARLLAFASAAWLIVGFGAVPQALLLRHLRFARVALADGFSAIAGTAMAVSLALLGVGSEALIVGALSTAAGTTAVTVVSAGLATPRLTVRGLLEVARFSGPVTSSALVYSLFRNVDYIILSARISSRDVGLYWRAYQLGVDYQSKISQIMTRVSFPIFSRTETLDELRAFRTRIVRVHAAVIVPMLATFVALAPVLIPWLFGDAWRGAVLPAQIMAVAGVADAVTTGTGPLMVAVGKPGALLKWSLVELVSYAVVIYALSSHGLKALATGVAVFALLSVLANQLALLRPHLGIPFAQLWEDIAPGLSAGLSVLVTVVPLRLVIEDDMPAVASVPLLSLVAAASSVAVLSLHRATWADLMAIRRRVVEGRRDIPGQQGDRANPVYPQA